MTFFSFLTRRSHRSYATPPHSANILMHSSIFNASNQCPAASIKSKPSPQCCELKKKIDRSDNNAHRSSKTRLMRHSSLTGLHIVTSSVDRRTACDERSKPWAVLELRQDDFERGRSVSAAGGCHRFNRGPGLLVLRASTARYSRWCRNKCIELRQPDDGLMA